MRRRFIGSVSVTATEAGAIIDLSSLTLRDGVSTIDFDPVRNGGSTTVYYTTNGASAEGGAAIAPGGQLPRFDVDLSAFLKAPHELRTGSGLGTAPCKVDVWEVVDG